jgi:hypothetical protein
MKTSRLVLLTLALLALGLSGCSKGPALVPVAGKVVHNGKGVCPGSVQFQPVEGSGGQTASGLLHEDGSFTLRTLQDQQPRDGAAPGKYKVTLSLGGGTTHALAKYTQLSTTTVEVEVPPGGKKDLVIDLK